MTESEFVSKLGEMKRRGRGLLVFGVSIFIAMDAMAVYWLFFYRTHSRSYVLVSGAILMMGWGVAAATLLYCFKRQMIRDAPRCPVCNKSLTWSERARVVA